jgi:transcriptional regulator with XRE-family HTH domain
MDQTTIRRRLQGLRESRSLNQAKLADVLGFKDRQTLSDIELGKRNVAPDELVRAAEYFGVDSGYFTDPFELAGEAKLSWRKFLYANDLESFEQLAGGLIAAYHHLRRLMSINDSSLRLEAKVDDGSIPQASSYHFVEVLGRGIEQGHLSARRAAKLMEMTLDDLSALFTEHGLTAPYDL